MKRLLIISNNVLSNTKNNGKTILSFFSGLNDVKIGQLYFSDEVPTVEGYDYFQISDYDIIKGLFSSKKRGRKQNVLLQDYDENYLSIGEKVGRNTFTLLIREFLWWNKWNSHQLQNWLRVLKPDAIFFVAGEALFAYDICEQIREEFDTNLSVYVTDDYIMPRSNENYLDRIRRKLVRKKLINILHNKATMFYTISETMRSAYLKELGIDSNILVNMSEDLKDHSGEAERRNTFNLVYTGGFYYGRSDILEKLALAIVQYNKNAKDSKAKLIIYSNTEPDNNTQQKININGASEYAGSLNRTDLKKVLNASDVLVFVESFDKDQIEKTKYSLSTKIPEYMSVQKPIFAIGPANIGSMQYLSDVAICANDVDSISSLLTIMINDSELRMQKALEARQKFLKTNRENAQRKLWDNIFGANTKR